MEDANRRRPPTIDEDTAKLLREVPRLPVLPAEIAGNSKQKKDDRLQRIEQTLQEYERRRESYEQLAGHNPQYFEDYLRVARDPGTTNYQRKGYVDYRENLTSKFTEAGLALAEVSDALKNAFAHDALGTASVAKLNEMISSQGPGVQALSSQLARSQEAFLTFDKQLSTARIPRFTIEAPVREKLLAAAPIPQLLSAQQWRDQTSSRFPFGDEKFKVIEAGLRDYAVHHGQHERTAAENADNLSHFEGELESAPPTNRYLDYRQALKKTLDASAASLRGLSDRLNELGEVKSSRQSAVDELRRGVRAAETAIKSAEAAYTKATDLVATIRAESQNKAQLTLIRVPEGRVQTRQGSVTGQPDINKPLPALPATPRLESRAVTEEELGPTRQPGDTPPQERKAVRRRR